MRRLQLLSLLLLALLAGVPASGQETAQKQPAPTQNFLAVEIRNAKERPSYISGTGGIWFGRFGRLGGWSPPANFLPVLAVDFSSQIVDERTLKIKVSLHRGERQFDQQTEAGVYTLAEGETRVAEELKAFGVTPIEFRVVRVRRQAYAPPFFESRVSALQLVGIEARETLFPSYTVRLRNLSGKDIAAFDTNFFNERGHRLASRSQHPQNETLIKPGDVYELRVSGGDGGEMTAEGLVPDRLQKVLVQTVLFTDGTFEGEAQPAAEMSALKLGRKLQLTRAVALMRQTLRASNEDEAASVARFKAQVSALGEEVEPQTVEDLAARFPTLGAGNKKTLHDRVRFHLHRVKIDLLKAVGEFEAGRAAAPARVTFREWLEGTKENYEKWIARL